MFRELTVIKYILSWRCGDQMTSPVSRLQSKSLSCLQSHQCGGRVEFMSCQRRLLQNSSIQSPEEKNLFKWWVIMFKLRTGKMQKLSFKPTSWIWGSVFPMVNFLSLYIYMCFVFFFFHINVYLVCGCQIQVSSTQHLRMRRLVSCRQITLLYKTTSSWIVCFRCKWQRSMHVNLNGERRDVKQR